MLNPPESERIDAHKRTALSPPLYQILPGRTETSAGHISGIFVDVEKGKPRAPIGLVRRTIEALGITLSPEIAGQQRREDDKRRFPSVDLDAIVAAARKK